MRLRRALHFVPGANEKLFQKALGLDADSLILDLEDAVTPDRKGEARDVVTDWLREGDFGRREKVVRMNPLDTAWGRDDLDATMAGQPDAYLVPKVRTPAELEEIDRILAAAEKREGRALGTVRLLVLATETPEGLLCIGDLARTPRTDVLSWGPEDLAAAIGAPRNRDETGQYLEVFKYARSMTILAAAAAGIQPIDTVYVDIRDSEGLRREAQEGAWMGFSGKITIHPDQIPVVNEVFTPSADEISRSQALLEAFAEHARAGEMVFRFEGRMVDVPHKVQAEKTIERAKQAGLL